jgi:ribonuclease R
MLPSSQELVEHVERHPGAATRRLAGDLGVDAAEFDDFVSLLLRLQLEGSVIRVPQGGWDIPERTPYRVGSLTLDRRGQGYVRSAAGTIREEDIFIRPDDIRGALPGDTVLVRVEGRPPRGKPPRGKKEGLLREGKIVDVIQRGRRLIRGRFVAGKKGGQVRTSDPRLPEEIHVSAEETAGAEDGEKVLIRVLDGAVKGGRPRARVVLKQRDEGTYGGDLGMIREVFDLPGAYPAEARAEAEAKESPRDGAPWPGRADLRGEQIFTIDPLDAKDFDDAVSLARLPGGGFRLGVHIADVSHYVAPNSRLDREAESRGTSVYLPGTVIPMLPERIANDLSSLRPLEDRLTKTVRMTFTARGEPAGVEIGRSVIRSVRRFTYEEALAILELHETGKAGANLPPDHGAFAATLAAMAELRDLLHAERHKRGALYLDIPKLRVTLDEEGQVSGLGRDARDPSHSLIEEFMLAANEAVAAYFIAKGLPLVARVHPPPDDKKLEDFRGFLAALGMRLGGKGGSHELQRLVEKVAGDPLSSTIQLALLRTMGHAEYVMGAGLHFALATSSYCHFTSPIRRYPDLLVHQVLDEHLDGALKPSRRREWDKRLPHAAEKSSELERRAEEAEREMAKLLLIRYLAPLVGEEMNARIVSVHPFGFFVRVEETLVEGLVHVATLEDDYYEFDSEKLTLSGRRARKKFGVGERVRVELSDVDVDLREISFRFVKRLGG